MKLLILQDRIYFALPIKTGRKFLALCSALDWREHRKCQVGICGLPEWSSYHQNVPRAEDVIGNGDEGKHHFIPHWSLKLQRKLGSR